MCYQVALKYLIVVPPTGFEPAKNRLEGEYSSIEKRGHIVYVVRFEYRDEFRPGEFAGILRISLESLDLNVWSP